MRHASRLDAEAPSDSMVRRQRKTDAAGLQNPARRGGDPWLGALVDGRYKVEEIIGRGGMGVVYKIKHQRMGKVAAMKVMHSELARDPEVVGRFQREAEAVSRLTHPNTVQVFDFGTHDGSLYLVMEYVRGQDLGSLIDRDGAMTFKRVAPLLAQVCAALEEAHDLGVIHRDLKPENILVSRTHSGQDFVKVLDFGLAKLSEREETSEVTSRGSIVGTPYYMSPEQIRADEDIDARADIYSVGALAYRLFTADNAFNAKTPVGVLTKHLTDDYEPIAARYPNLELAREMDEIVGKCMAKAPSARYQCVRDLLEDLEQLYTAQGASTSDIARPAAWLADTRGAPVPAVTNLALDIDHGMHASMRLQREDLDVFEKQLKRRHSVRLVLPIVALAALGIGAYFMLLRQEKPHTTELEPNNEMATASLIANNAKVTGFIGKRHNATAPDKDFYRLDVSPNPDGSDVISVVVTAPPNIDIQVDLYDLSGKLMAHADEVGVGEIEKLRRLRGNRPIVVAVSGVLSAKGSWPVENVSDSYELSVSISPIDERLESEPNDSRTDANRLAIGSPVTGFLDHRGDVDIYKIATAGEFQILISGGPDVPFQWRLNDEGKWRSTLKAKVTVEQGSTLAIRREGDAGSKAGEHLQSPDSPYTVDLSR